MNDTTKSGPAPTGREVEIVTGDGEIIKGTALGLPDGYDSATETLAVSLMRAEVDQQIATARAMPRSITRAVQNIITLATLDEESAEECIYALPRAGKDIRGPSVRLAEIVASQWGNCRVGTRVVHVDRFEKYVEAEGVYHDLESNAAITARVRRRISDKRGKLLTEDMIIVTGNAACAIAKRNAILGGVPKAVWRKAYGEVEAVVAGTQQTLASRRERVLKKFAHFGVTPEQIFVALGLPGLEDLTLEHLPTLTGMFAALKSGESNVEEMFPKVAAAAAVKPQTIAEKLDAVANGGNGGNGGKDDEASGTSQAAASGSARSAEAAVQPTVGSGGGNNSGYTTATITGGLSSAGVGTVVGPTITPTSDMQTMEVTVERSAGGAGPSEPTEDQKKAVAAEGAKKREPKVDAPAAEKKPVPQTGLKRLHEDLMGCLSAKKLENTFKTFVSANELEPTDVAYVAAERIKKAHQARLAGESSPAECDQVVRQVLAS